MSSEIFQFNKINQYSIDELTKLEQDISSEFKTLAQQYLTSRLSRINTMIDKITNSIKLTSTNDKNWLKIFNFEFETINNIKTNCEDLILNENSKDILNSVDEYEKELQEIFNNLQSPLDFDDIITNDEGLDKLPFPYLFNQVFTPHKKHLQAVVEEKDYQTRLIMNLAQGNSVVIWKQYYRNMIQRKQQLVQETLDELTSLYREYHNLDVNKVINNQNKYYYKSVITTQELNKTKNHDSGYVDIRNTRLIPRNKIELTATRKRIRKSKRVYKLDETQRVLPCQGLNDGEIEQDLWLLKQGKVNQVQQQEEQIQEEQSDEDEDEENYSTEQQELRIKYKQLLSTQELPLVMPQLPPLEKFPKY
ncbi:hypothetical protein JA1_002997 [Spathaspora sp. JA1]|nr:hypothetical protein JA1_002997 [Spathaspora sp. JA1]